MSASLPALFRTVWLIVGKICLPTSIESKITESASKNNSTHKESFSSSVDEVLRDRDDEFDEQSCGLWVLPQNV